jgi:spore germination protein
MHIILRGDKMQIHVVQPNETVFTIAQRYNVSVEEVVNANDLAPNSRLVTGQALVIPVVGSFYTVKSGDSLYKIANNNGLTVQELARVNNISPETQLQVGQRIYLPAPRKVPKQTLGYVQPTAPQYNNAVISDFRNNARNLTYVAPFGFEAKRDGTLKAPPLNPILDIAKDNNVVSMLVVNNIENGNFSPDLASIIFNNPTVQNKLINNIFDIARRQGFRDIHFDFENIYPKDRQPYNRFLENVRSRLPEGYILSTTLVPKTSANQTGQTYTAHDYAAHGRIADYVVIMTYDWGWQGGPPMAVSPIGPVRQVLEYAITEIPASKIMMGQNLYGFDWTLPFKQGGPPAKAVSAKGAVELAARQGVNIQYDNRSQAPFFKYRTPNGVNHEVWFEDARSIKAKFDLLRELKLRGIAYWKLGLPFPQNWLLLTDNFRITKL